jgi:enoyl-[acyl-carrier protein] reductase II
VRVLKNKLSKQIEALDKESRVDEIEALGSGKLALAMRQGDTQMGSLMAGQISAMVCEIQPAAEIVDDMMSQAEAVLTRLGTLPKSR